MMEHDSGGIGLRYKQDLIFDPKSHVSGLCMCGSSFSYFGEEWRERYREWLDEHDCPYRDPVASPQGDGAGE